MAKAKTILIVDDELPIRTMIRLALEKAEFAVLEAEDTQAAESQIKQYHPNLILLDWMLPKMSGLDFIRRLKKHVSMQKIPVIMLTAKAEEENKVAGLEMGADDYVVKPFSPRELVARVNAVIRRGSTIEEPQQLSVRELVIDLQAQRCTVEGEFIKLGPLEFRLLCFFIQHPDRVYSRDELLSYVWGEQAYVDERTVDVHVRRLRRHLKPGDHDKLIQTVHGSGYRFSEQFNV